MDTTTHADAQTADTPGPGLVEITLHINGQDHTLHIDPCVTLLDALREYIGMTGTKKGCDHGQCGACTVLVDGRRIDACLTFAVMNTGKSITSIEGLEKEGELHPVQQEFIVHDGFQCGYCTPGQTVSAVVMLKENWSGIVSARYGRGIGRGQT